VKGLSSIEFFHESLSHLEPKKYCLSLFGSPYHSDISLRILKKPSQNIIQDLAGMRAGVWLHLKNSFRESRAEKRETNFSLSDFFSEQDRFQKKKEVA
jgi:hypothetical protein